MKLFLFFTGLIFLTNTYAQQVELLGKYSASFMGVESIEFKGKDSFYFNAFYCIEGFYGKGRCEIRDKCLYLFFENNKNGSDSARPAVIIPSKNKDSMSTIKMSLVDNYARPISDVTIEVQSDKGVQPDSYEAPRGHIKFKIKKDAFPIVLKTSPPGFNEGIVRLDSNSNYTITLYHSYSHDMLKVLNKGETFVYEIEDLSEDLILMRPKSEGGPFRKYQKQ